MGSQRETSGWIEGKWTSYIHKKDYPGRLIVSSINNHTSKNSEFVDYKL